MVCLANTGKVSPTGQRRQIRALGSANATDAGSCTKLSRTTADPAAMTPAARQATMNARTVFLLFAPIPQYAGFRKH
jgi:hypothetical protein